MIFVDHAGLKPTREQAARLAATHITGVIRTVGPEHAATLLAETLPHWTAESYRKAADPNNHPHLIEHLLTVIKTIQ